ncbi:hypothetical protein [Streptomyces sediminimaris]
MESGTVADSSGEEGASGADDDASAESVEIPKQQSGGQAADIEAGEDART